ncbi:MAG: UDP-glucose/GDP-mannose dehydrogenase family protein [Candidatus Omnitrophota bacterium]
MKIAVVGSGYVGLVSGACFASLGNEVICVDIDAKKIAQLKKGILPIYEPGLEELVRQGIKSKHLSFSTDLRGAAARQEIVFIAVGTPPKPNGEADLTYVENVARTIAKEIRSYKVIVEKSTVPVQTGAWIDKTVARHARKGASFDVASNPEFLREGSAVADFMNPDRIVLGVESKRAEKVLTELYKPLKANILITDIKSAEIIKHASNSFLAMKISFINAISRLCEVSGADVEKVALGIGLDRRIGKSFLNAGIGFGGFCFPKDLSAFIRISEKLGYDFQLLKAVQTINDEQKLYFVRRIEEVLWNINSKKIGVLGLSFKPNTDDMRYAPSIDILRELKAHGASIKAYDPHAMPKAKEIIKGVRFCRNPFEVCTDCDCLVILTEWDEFKKLDLKKVKRLLAQPVIIDGRNLYDPQEMKRLGFRYYSIGRS